MVILELKKVIESLCVKEGDLICVFSDITSFGIPTVIKKQVLKKGLPFLMDSYIETLQAIVGRQGGILMPTFTYSACHNEVFNTIKTPSTVGSLTDHFRQTKGVKRSSHPIFSFAGWGEKAEKLLKVEDFNCFGERSIFGKLYDLNAKYLMFGVDIQHGATFVYYSEQKAGIDYRYFKDFTGVIDDKGRKRNVKVRYYVRDLDINYTDYWYDVEKIGLKENVISESRFSGGRILVLQSQEIDEIIQKQLRLNKNFLIKMQ